MMMELFGFIALFGPFFPIALAFLRKMPILGTILDLPVISTVVDKIAGKEPQSMV
jgi:hypothetical protein